jgi:meso-butanediol dehydrogenase/(S,S)-butanediol dehydrogenase/diacetyl reductase
MGRLDNKTALVTGSTTGIGEATARLFATQGARVMVSGRNAERGRSVLDAIEAAGGAADFIRTDMGEAGACEKLVDETVARFGRLDILVNNAAVLYNGTALELAEAEWHEMFAINVTAVFLTSRAALRHMLASKSGVIVNLASESGLNGEPGLSAYCATKGAVIQLTKSMALDHIREGVRINALCPGETHTQMVEDWFAAKPGTIEEAKAEVTKGLPIKRLARPDEVAQAVLFLASNDSSYCVGTVMSADGGLNATGGPYPL